MVKGATTVGTGLGWDVERQDNDEYLAQGWIQVDRRDKTSFDYTIGGSETLEYAIDDSAIAQLAAVARRSRTPPRRSPKRAGNWRNLFNPATGYLVGAATPTARFPPGPAFQRSPLPGIGQDGWEEGNSIQYTWSVPQDLRGLFDAMGGNAKRRRASSTASSRTSTPAASSRTTGPATSPRSASRGSTTTRARRARTQDVVRRIVTDLYAPTPERRARQRRSRRDVVVVRVGGDRACIPRRPAGRSRAREPAVPRT